LSCDYLYRIRPTRTSLLAEGATAEEDRVITEHFEYLKGLTRERVVLLAGRTLNRDDTGFGIVIFRAESEGDARRVMENDPAVQAGVFRAELFPYGVALIGDELCDRARG
jgi:uncharacterized protein YciI